MPQSQIELSAEEIRQNSKFIQAGAGAGKTTLLIQSFIEFTLNFKKKHQRWPRVILTTFTRKATQEIKERLLLKAVELGHQDLFEFINKKSYVHISTIHGVLSLILAEGYAALGMPARLKIVDDTRWAKMQKRLANTLFRQKNQYIPLLEYYSLDQLLKFTQLVMTYRSQYGEVQSVDKNLLIKISEERRKKALHLLTDIFSLIPVWPDKWKDYLKFLKNIEVGLQQPLTNTFLEKLEAPPRKPALEKKNPSIDPAAHEQLEIFIEEYLGKKGFRKADTLEFIETFSEISSLLDQYITDMEKQIREYRCSTGEITISDLENLTTEILRSQPEVFDRFSNDWDFYMIDEFQDTSPVQVRLMEALIKNKPSFIVGDPQQSIYLFRGARSEVFHSRKEFSIQNKIPLVDLNKNYRTRPPLMKAINHLVTQMGPQFRAMETKDEDVGRVKQMSDVFFVSTEDEMVATVLQIKTMIEAGVAPQSICVLSREKKELRHLAELAEKNGIDVQLNLSAGFENKREVLDLMAYLKFLSNPHDNINLITLLRSPWFYVSDPELFEALRKEKIGSHWQRILKHLVDHQGVQALLKCLDIYTLYGSSRALRYLTFDRGLLESALYADVTGKREANVVKLIKDINDAEKTPGFNILEFVNQYFSSVKDDLSVGESEAVPVVMPNCISLMTVHASKGLEFDHVMIVGVNKRQMFGRHSDFYFDPAQKTYAASLKIDEDSAVTTLWSDQIKQQMALREEQESQRVFYVAVTRAKKSLTLVAEFSDLVKRKVESQSWCSLLQWPADEASYQSVSPDIKISVFDSVEPISELQQTVTTDVQVRDRLQFQTKQMTEQFSVTTLLDNKSADTIEPAAVIKTVSQQTQLKNLSKAQMGTRAHMIFEALKYSADDKLQEALNEQTRPMIDYLRQNQKINFNEIIQKGHSEWGFGLKLKDSKIIGQIDLWAELDDCIHVVDYKTGSPEFAEKALQQLTIYAVALNKMKMISPNKPIKLSAVYVSDQTFVAEDFKNIDDLQKKKADWLKGMNE